MRKTGCSLIRDRIRLFVAFYCLISRACVTDRGCSAFFGALLRVSFFVTEWVHKEYESSGLYVLSISPAARVEGCDTAGHTFHVF